MSTIRSSFRVCKELISLFFSLPVWFALELMRAYRTIHWEISRSKRPRIESVDRAVIYYCHSDDPLPDDIYEFSLEVLAASQNLLTLMGGTQRPDKQAVSEFVGFAKRICQTRERFITQLNQTPRTVVFDRAEFGSWHEALAWACCDTALQFLEDDLGEELQAFDARRARSIFSELSWSVIDLDRAIRSLRSSMERIPPAADEIPIRETAPTATADESAEGEIATASPRGPGRNRKRRTKAELNAAVASLIAENRHRETMDNPITVQEIAKELGYQSHSSIADCDAWKALCAERAQRKQSRNGSIDPQGVAAAVEALEHLLPSPTATAKVAAQRIAGTPEGIAAFRQLINQDPSGKNEREISRLFSD